MHIIFVEPNFPAAQRQFVRALKQVGAQVTGIGETHPDALPPEVWKNLDGYEQVRSVTDEQALYDAVRRVQARGWVDRMEATIEAHMLSTARVREMCDIPGVSYQQTLIGRDKTLMKEFMRSHGIPCAQSRAAESAEQVIQFGREMGYPIIIKPRDGAGASKTWKIESEDDLGPALWDTGVLNGRSVAIEEFIEGHEGFYDTLTVNGQIVHEFICHYYPNVLEAMRHRWISPMIMCTNRVDADGYDELKQMGHRVISELGLGTTPTHMEWFVGSKGLKFSEIGLRPPGVSHWDVYCAANEIDIYKEWADAFTYNRTWGKLSRRYSAAILALRPTQDGRIVRYEGLGQMQEKYGQWVFNAHFPTIGTPTQPVEAGYMANAWIHIRYPDYDTLHTMCMEIANSVRVVAE